MALMRDWNTEIESMSTDRLERVVRAFDVLREDFSMVRMEFEGFTTVHLAAVRILEDRKRG
jgi:hypothetical protein